MADKGAKPSASSIITAPITEGVILDTMVSNYVAPEGALSFAENVHCDVIGVTTTRAPFVRGSAFSGRVSSPIGVFIINSLNSEAKAQVYWQEGRHLKQQTLITTGSVNDSSTFFSSSTIRNRYDVIQGYVLITNYGAASAVYYTSGQNILTTGVPVALDTKFPASINVISAGFVGRVWGAQVPSAAVIPPNDCRLYYSDVIPSGGITALTTATQQYVSINANRGEYITALVRTQQVLFVFTNNGVFRVFGTTSLDNSPVSQVGAPSPEAVVQTKMGIFFYHYSGIYQLNLDGTSQEISRKIYPLIRRVPTANQESVFSWFDDDHIYFYLGNLTGFDSSKYYIVRYTLSTKVWTIYSTRTPLACGMSAFFGHFDSGNETATTENWYPTTVIMTASDLATFGVGDPSTQGQSYYGDFNSSGNPSENIYIQQISEWMNFGNDSEYKRISGIAAAGTLCGGFNVQYQVDNDGENVWRDIGTMGPQFSTLFRDFQSIEFNRIRFRISGQTEGRQSRISPIVILALDNLGFKNG